MVKNPPANAVKALVTQSCLTLCNPMDCSLLGSSVHGILQAWILGRRGGGCHFLLQGIFLTQGSNACLLHCRHMLYHLSHQRTITGEPLTNPPFLARHHSSHLHEFSVLQQEVLISEVELISYHPPGKFTEGQKERGDSSPYFLLTSLNPPSS